MHYHEEAIEEQYLKSSNERYRKLFFNAIDRCAHILCVINESKLRGIELILFKMKIMDEAMNKEKIDNWRKWYYRVLSRIEKLLNYETS